MFKDKKKVKNTALVLWSVCVAIYFILISITNNAMTDILGMLVIFIGIVAFGIFFASLLYLAFRGSGLKEGSKMVFGHLLVVFLVFATFSLFALIDWNQPTEEPIKDTQVEDVVKLEGIESEIQNIECYIDGKKVFTDRDTCRELSEKEPEKVTETEIKYVPTPTKPSYTPTTDTTKKEPVELKQTCTECSTDYWGKVRCTTYKAYFCPKP